jgi:hypothetical protein
MLPSAFYLSDLLVDLNRLMNSLPFTYWDYGSQWPVRQNRGPSEPFPKPSEDHFRLLVSMLPAKPSATLIPLIPACTCNFVFHIRPKGIKQPTQTFLSHTMPLHGRFAFLVVVASVLIACFGPLLTYAARPPLCSNTDAECQGPVLIEYNNPSCSGSSMQVTQVSSNDTLSAGMYACVEMGDNQSMRRTCDAYAGLITMLFTYSRCQGPVFRTQVVVDQCVNIVPTSGPAYSLLYRCSIDDFYSSFNAPTTFTAPVPESPSPITDPYCSSPSHCTPDVPYRTTYSDVACANAAYSEIFAPGLNTCFNTSDSNIMFECSGSKLLQYTYSSGCMVTPWSTTEIETNACYISPHGDSSFRYFCSDSPPRSDASSIIFSISTIAFTLSLLVLIF